jgi:hypothetical protein
MVIFRSPYRVLFRYDAPDISRLILGGSIRVTTLEACRNAENEAARDPGEGTKTTTSLPGTNSLNSLDLAKLLGVDPAGVEVVGKNSAVTHAENAVHRTETTENAFVFCTSTINNDLMRSNFGGGCLKIRDALAFFELVDKHLLDKQPPRSGNLASV